MIHSFGFSFFLIRINHFHEAFETQEKGFDGSYYPYDVSYRGGGVMQLLNNVGRNLQMYKEDLSQNVLSIMFRYETHKTGVILRSGNWLEGEDQECRGFRSDAMSKNESSNLIEDTKNVTNRPHGQPHSPPTNQLPHSASFVLVPTVVAGTGRLGQYGMIKFLIQRK